MQFPRALRRINRVVTNPILGAIAWIVPPFAVVHHVGRKSQRAYQTPVMAFRTNAGFAIAMTYGRDVDWARNLLAANGGEIEQFGRRVPVRNPRMVESQAAYPLLPALVRPALEAADFPAYLLLDLAS